MWSCATTDTANVRDLILQYSDSHLLNGKNLDDHLLKVLACLLLCLEFNQVIILWKVSKKNKKDWKPNRLLPLLTLSLLILSTLIYIYLHLILYLPQLQILIETNQQPRYAMCTNITGNSTSRA